MWQRARVLWVSEVNDIPVGYELWVRGRPEIRSRGTDVRSGEFFRWPAACPYFETNIVWQDRAVLHVADELELLPEFTEDPPRIPWGAWNEAT